MLLIRLLSGLEGGPKEWFSLISVTIVNSRNRYGILMVEEVER